MRRASRGLQGGFRRDSRGLQGGLRRASKGLQGEGGFKGASRGLEKGFKGASRGLEKGFKGASMGLQALLTFVAAPAMIFLNGRPVISWSRSQKSIALSSCESEYLSAVGGAAEGIFIGRLWSFLVKKPVKVDVITDSSSCRAFSQRQGVGRLKHVETKYLWLQQMIKDTVISMHGIATLLNMSDLGTKKLTKARRAF